MAPPNAHDSDFTKTIEHRLIMKNISVTHENPNVRMHNLKMRPWTHFSFTTFVLVLFPKHGLLRLSDRSLRG